MVSSCRNSGTLFQELRYPFAGTAVQFRQESSYQEVIRLNVICEYNLIETAEILNVNVNTVRTWSARGLVKLREEFERLDRGE